MLTVCTKVIVANVRKLVWEYFGVGAEPSVQNRQKTV